MLISSLLARSTKCQFTTKEIMKTDVIRGAMMSDPGSTKIVIKRTDPDHVLC